MQDATWAQTCKGTNATVGRNVGLINNAIGEDLGASTNMSIFNMAVWANMNAIASPLIEAESVGAGVWQYPVATSRFGTQRIDVSGTHELRATHDAEILVCTSGNATSLLAGQAAVLRNGDSVTLSGNATVFRTWGTH